MDEETLDTLIDAQLELVRAWYGESIGPEEAYRLARNLAIELDKIPYMKEDFEFTVCSGREPNQYTAGVKVWEVAPNTYHISGYWDMPHTIENLGTPVTKRELALKPGSLPPSVMKEVQDILFLGIETMKEQGIRVSSIERRRVHDLAKT